MRGTTKYLDSFFVGVFAKRLSAVEASPAASHQHELNGISKMKDLLGLEDRSFPVKAFFLSDEEEIIDWEGHVTWYDSRKKHPTRTEHRMYMPDSPVYESASEGDLLVVAKTTNDTLVFIFAKAGSTAENQMIWLFGIDPIEGTETAEKNIEKSENTKIGYAARKVLELLGIEDFERIDDYLDIMLDKFKGAFPTTRIFSSFARETASKTCSIEEPDKTILTWMEQEEMLFRTLERHIVTKRLETGFGTDVDTFIEFSLGVHNRRKSRAGYALENHAEQIFIDHKVMYSRGVRTENKSTPDFLFPGITYYRDLMIDDNKLTMLGAKLSCKDRWRQVLPEADRIKDKHLLTLEPGISESQTDAMIEKKVRLVVPEELHITYTKTQQNWLLNLYEFIDLLKGRQALL